jgi:hypothetical protein
MRGPKNIKSSTTLPGMRISNFMVLQFCQPINIGAINHGTAQHVATEGCFAVVGGQRMTLSNCHLLMPSLKNA